MEKKKKQDKTKETTFAETFKWLSEHGWDRITPAEYLAERRANKHQTAKVGLYGFFKLKKSNEELKIKASQ